MSFLKLLKEAELFFNKTLVNISQVKGFKRQTYFELIKPIQRAGFKQFSDWLHVNTDFLNAPASTRFHGAEKGGLLNHSLRVDYKTPTSFCESFLFIFDNRN